MTATEPWFLAYERDEIRKSGDLGPPMDPRSDVCSGPAGLLDELPDRLRDVSAATQNSPQEVNTHA